MEILQKIWSIFNLYNGVWPLELVISVLFYSVLFFPPNSYLDHYPDTIAFIYLFIYFLPVSPFGSSQIHLLTLENITQVSSLLVQMVPVVDTRPSSVFWTKENYFDLFSFQYKKFFCVCEVFWVHWGFSGNNFGIKKLLHNQKNINISSAKLSIRFHLKIFLWKGLLSRATKINN